jgi:WD40 repeat protein
MNSKISMMTKSHVSDSLLMKSTLSPLESKHLFNCLIKNRDHTVRVCDLRTNKELYKMEHELYKCGSNTNRLCISSNSRYVIVGSQNGSIVIFDLTNGEIEEIYTGVHTTAVVACEWQPRGTKFASIDNLGGLFIWGSG